MQHQFQTESADDLSNNANTTESDYLTVSSNNDHMISKSKKQKEKSSKKLRQKPINSKPY